MSTYTVFFILAGLGMAAIIITVVYLLLSRKRSLVYRLVLRQETEFFDAFSTAARLAGPAKQSLSLKKATLPSASYQAGAAIENLPAALELTELDEPEEAAQACLAGTAQQDELRPPGESMAEKSGCFDAFALQGRYVLEEEIKGGGMSRVFVARSNKLGNRWIIKYIAHKNGALANEENILKQLNHISLPKIIDILHDDSGVYLVESYIEGLTLDTVLAENAAISQILIQDWAEQLTQVLSYLHNMEPYPVYHFDLKPSNIMVTHDNRLVLIDFGIARQLGQTEGAVAVTYKYAAPEQLKHTVDEKNAQLLENRFGALPQERMRWQPDARTDIYCLGLILFELAVGQIPTRQNFKLLEDNVSWELYVIIQKCLQLNPQDRYQNAWDLLTDIQKIKGSKVKMVKTLLMRKLATAAMAFSVVISLGSLGGGYYIYGQENLAVLEASPPLITLSLQQSAELSIKKLLPDGSITEIDAQNLRWSFNRNNTARIDGQRIVGLNIGQVEITGRYQKKEITLNVNVVRPLDGMVDISQIYKPGLLLSLLAGTGEREHKDGPLTEATFVAPESIDIAPGGALYITDSGRLRKISGDRVESIDLAPAYLSSRLVRCYNADIYILTYAWQDDDSAYYALLRAGEAGVQELYKADAFYTAIEDFVISGGLIYFIEVNEGVKKTYLKTLDLSEANGIQVIGELPPGSCALAPDEDGRVYIANPESGVIQAYYKGALTYFAGMEYNKAFIDGAAPLFYMPQRLNYAAGYLYVWDFNVLRRIEAQNGVAGECITLAGAASPLFDMAISQDAQAVTEIILPNSKLTDFAVWQDKILLTDPKRGVIWLVE